MLLARLLMVHSFCSQLTLHDMPLSWPGSQTAWLRLRDAYGKGQFHPLRCNLITVKLTVPLEVGVSSRWLHPVLTWEVEQGLQTLIHLLHSCLACNKITKKKNNIITVHLCASICLGFFHVGTDWLLNHEWVTTWKMSSCQRVNGEKWNLCCWERLE